MPFLVKGRQVRRLEGRGRRAFRMRVFKGRQGQVKTLNGPAIVRRIYATRQGVSAQAACFYEGRSDASKGRQGVTVWQSPSVLGSLGRSNGVKRPTQDKHEGTRNDGQGHKGQI